jgi:hypothetical protein
VARGRPHWPGPRCRQLRPRGQPKRALIAKALARKQERIAPLKVPAQSPPTANEDPRAFPFGLHAATLSARDAPASAGHFGEPTNPCRHESRADQRRRRETPNSPTAGRRGSLAVIRSAASTSAGSSSPPQLAGVAIGLAQSPKWRRVVSAGAVFVFGGASHSAHFRFRSGRAATLACAPA